MRFPPSIARQGYGEECQELSLRGWKSLLLSAYICVCMRVCMCVCPSLCLRVLFMLECTCLSPGDYDSLPSLRSLSSYHTLYAQSNDMYNFTNRPAIITRSSKRVLPGSIPLVKLLSSWCDKNLALLKPHYLWDGGGWLDADVSAPCYYRYTPLGNWKVMMHEYQIKLMDRGSFILSSGSSVFNWNKLKPRWGCSLMDPFPQCSSIHINPWCSASSDVELKKKKGMTRIPRTFFPCECISVIWLVGSNK